MSLPAARKDLAIVNMGPHRTSMRGVLWLIITLDGDSLRKCIIGLVMRYFIPQGLWFQNNPTSKHMAFSKVPNAYMD